MCSLEDDVSVWLDFDRVKTKFLAPRSTATKTDHLITMSHHVCNALYCFCSWAAALYATAKRRRKRRTHERPLKARGVVVAAPHDEERLLLVELLRECVDLIVHLENLLNLL